MLDKQARKDRKRLITQANSEFVGKIEAAWDEFVLTGTKRDLQRAVGDAIEDLRFSTLAI